MASRQRRPDPYRIDEETAPLTDEEVGRLRPAAEAFEALGLPAPRPVGRPRSESPKVRISLRVSAHTLDAFKASGKGWQTRMNDALNRAARRLPSGKG